MRQSVEAASWWGEIVVNVCFGGPKRNRLYSCGKTSLYSLFLAVNAAM